MFYQYVSLVQLYHPRSLAVQRSIPRLILRSRLQDILCNLQAISSISGFNGPFKPLSSTYLHPQESGRHLMTLQTPRSRVSLLDQPQSTHVNLLWCCACFFHFTQAGF